MVAVISGGDSLKRLFAALTENTFHAELGVADPPLVDYLVELLLRFVRTEQIYRARNAVGQRLEEVAGMMAEAEERTARPKRELHRHIGDFTLFWSGVYPEALKRREAEDGCDGLINYCEAGKRSYYIASTFDNEPFTKEAPVLRRLSEEFEMCSFGLNRVRQEWERMPESENSGVPN